MVCILYESILFFQHIDCGYAGYNMSATDPLFLFQTWHVAGKGTDRFYARPGALALP